MILVGNNNYKFKRIKNFVNYADSEFKSDSMDIINFAGDVSELPGYITNIDFNFGDQKGVALVFDKKKIK